MSTSSLSEAHATAVQPSLDDLLEEADDAHGQTTQARMHDAEAHWMPCAANSAARRQQFGA